MAARDLKYILKQSYDSSWALIIGINKYQTASPLNYAVSDAEEVKDIFIDELGFEEDKVTYLTDEEATKSNILKAFLSFSSEEVKVDDRLFIFFAGHGYTRTGLRGEVGYLVPYDADMDEYSSFIRWDELTRNSELIRAKHILFVMDACYGGLAVNRDMQSGSSRFLKDMYQRFSRQVITAGKADEAVADAGGPLPNHSVFTGHLIEGVRGKAANEHGVITANGLMAYVYAKVAHDQNSEQTPHYGQFDGDGDFIIAAPNIEELAGDKEKDFDELISVPVVHQQRSVSTLEEKVAYIKELLSAQKSQIPLHDFVTEEVRTFLSVTSEDNFVVGASYTQDDFLDRISSYEKCTEDLGAIIAVVAYWGTEQELNVIGKILSRASDRISEVRSGTTVWLNLRWYPLLLLLYQAGIAAVASKNYKSLMEIFQTQLGGSGHVNDEGLFVIELTEAISDLRRVEIFNKIPGHGQHYTPLSEYVFKQVQPALDDLFFLSKGYEPAFDEFEILYALVVADLQVQNKRRCWGPIGRFGWKYQRGNSPLTKILKEAESHREKWPPLEVGLFGGSYERFDKVASEFKQLVSELNWY